MALREFVDSHFNQISHVFADGRREVVLDDGTKHYFMGMDKYLDWCKGRTYMLDGKMYHSGYPCKKEVEE